jgi:hypothetical protein
VFTITRCAESWANAVPTSIAHKNKYRFMNPPKMKLHYTNAPIRPACGLHPFALSVEGELGTGYNRSLARGGADF